MRRSPEEVVMVRESRRHSRALLSRVGARRGLDDAAAVNRPRDAADTWVQVTWPTRGAYHPRGSESRRRFRQKRLVLTADAPHADVLAVGGDVLLVEANLV